MIANLVSTKYNFCAVFGQIHISIKFMQDKRLTQIDIITCSRSSLFPVNNPLMGGDRKGK